MFTPPDRPGLLGCEESAKMFAMVVVSPRLPTGRPRDCGISSNVDVCEEAKHHTELFWFKLYKLYSSQHSLGILYSRFSRYNNSDVIGNWPSAR